MYIYINIYSQVCSAEQHKHTSGDPKVLYFYSMLNMTFDPESSNKVKCPFLK